LKGVFWRHTSMNVRDTKTSRHMSPRAVIGGAGVSWSRRDFTRVAWHEVPGKTPQRRPSRRDGLIALFTRGWSSKLTFHRIKKSRRTPSHRPYGTGFFRDRYQAINCLATLIQSLQDKNGLLPNKTKLITPPCGVIASHLTSHLSRPKSLCVATA
jgi:hypothetical protein